MKVPILETERLVLRPHASADFADLAALWADPEVVKYIGGSPCTQEMSWARLLRYIGHWQALGFGYWAICDRSDGRFLGEAGFAIYHREVTPALPVVPEAGWLLSPVAQGRGLAREALACLHQWADENKDWDQAIAIIDPDHKASLRLASGLGYQPTGMARYQGAEMQVLTRPGPTATSV
ncbi:MULTISPECIES: GNAT family N-acetyltransferase [Pseudophaeobacter]|uniref:GNAT family N-acetyltransferase n=1 Tax=Pseudophaeobacter TaxID=1541822 RepID=UPI00242DCD76|nr:GNAT family N-acetyltransferase [Pseudophaeobacter profundi]